MTLPDLLQWLVQTTVASSAAILLVLVLRRPLRAAFGAGIAYALWALVTTRGRALGAAVATTLAGLATLAAYTPYSWLTGALVPPLAVLGLRLVRRTGNRRPIVLVEGGEGSIDQDMVHYGVFERFEAFEREDPNDTRWALSMQDWA